MTPAIVVDVGNTRIKWGRCADGRVVEMASLPHDDEKAWCGQSALWNLSSDDSWAVSGVHPMQIERFCQWLQRRPMLIGIINSHRQIPLSIDVDFPDKVGLDRLLNAVAANRARTPHKNSIIVDAGTAITVDFVSADGVFRGGAIMPGARLMAKALHEHTAMLPLLEDFAAVPMPGKNTEDALRAGIHAALIGGIGMLANPIESENAEVFYTGGDAERLVRDCCLPGRVWPEMTLEGIRLTAAQSSF